MPTALIADDEPHLASHLRDQLATLWPELDVVALARNGVEAAAGIETLGPDLAFLDIRMPGLSGLEVAQGITGRTRVVFVTAYDAHALEAFDQAALDYLLKPITRERLERSVQRLKHALVPARPPEDDARLADTLRALLSPVAASVAVVATTTPLRWIRASAGELTHQVAVDDVLFFHADEKYTCVQTASAEHLIRTPIAELAQQLDAQHFWQIHRSTIVNLRFLAGTRRDEASRLFVRLVCHRDELPVSRAYVHLFKAM